MKQLYTCWGENLDNTKVLQEYPRPLLVRNSYLNLNGYWDYAFTKEEKPPKKYDGKILVPFSPEAVLSGVHRQLQPEEYLWYRRVLSEKELKEGELEEKKGDRILLHFGAVDQACRVFVNGRCAGSHSGGYLPFDLDVTEDLHEGENELLVVVKDLSDTSYHSRGKQKMKNGGMFYTAQSGIWQTVWMEWVPQKYICSIETKPDLKKGQVRIRVNTKKNATNYICAGDRKTELPFEETKIEIQNPQVYTEPMRMPKELFGKLTEEKGKENESDSSGKRKILQTVIGKSNHWIEIPLQTIRLWNCETPYLYYFTVTTGNDQVVSYFAMREFSLLRQENEQVPRICLNGEVQFQNGVLDQGYWPDGLYTAPADEAFIFDLEEMKKTGFNMVRKHLKIEPQRWYYHCDRLGIVVWQDMVNGGNTYKHWFVTYLATFMSWMKISMRDIYPRLLSREERAGRHEFVREMKETVQLLKGHPSIAAWVIFNEGWGQFQANDLTEVLRKLDSDRLIDQASGWFDQGGGDFSSLHNYFFQLFIRPEEKRASVLSEFGGYSYRIEEHSACPKSYGYGICKTKKELNQRYQTRVEKMKKLIREGLCASVYTQWSDIEEEVNGVYTYDRKVRKIKESID